MLIEIIVKLIELNSKEKIVNIGKDGLETIIYKCVGFNAEIITQNDIVVNVTIIKC